MSILEKKNKHLTYDDRIEIQECLNKGFSFRAISERIGKSPTTVSREIKTHLQSHSNSFVKTDSVCPLLLRAPFVCNGCEKKVVVRANIKDRCILQKKLRLIMKAFLLMPELVFH